MDEPERRRWTLLLLRDGGVRAGRWSFAPAAGAAAATVTVLLLVAAGAAGALWWAGRAEDQRVRSLQEEVSQLRADRQRMRSLAVRLDSIARDYGRLRRALAVDADSAGAGVRLPPVAGEPGTPAGDGAREDRWRWPLAREGFVTRSFADGAGAAGHPGLDVAVPSGSYVRAARPGIVAEAGADTVYGRYVRLEHPDGASSLYGHADWVFVAAGDTVEGGEVIALSGNTGRSSAPHLHFEVRRDGRPVDPARLLHGGTTGRRGASAVQQGGGTP